MHDNCTTGSGKKGLLGSSARFINKKWEFCNIALFITVHNGSRASGKVKVRITSRIEALFRIDSEAMAQFTMSDTASSVHKVSKIFEDSLPTDCTMHVRSLCLQYGMDMRKNYETVYVVAPDTNKQKKELCLFSVGGPFPGFAALIKKVRNLNNYFNSPQRVERLTKVQQFYDLPELSPIVDCDTRVASSATLFQRTIINYSIFPALRILRRRGGVQ
ncbi:hypothetical protein PC116_g16912 [Phytophthora cactorum]|uniref:Uncharacterized protein n=2 Tax=Phytophthora cactorum TaxID=29920 RepID=A0A329S4Z5_9STRA|nr:hypothetical protein Pcac1_g15613 [Phytophthora cactorum]KAG2817589.1 hypothetical protein PC112_g12986 [Phytophthora cactorum]KAG2854287.1 hypothetical protein PC113_g13440 [Phytophthora cactorum]KAG2899405.1 hypothetical protein PC114_g13965 [Phytophthora cactorum]KAG2944227.1 hypothetical protein PC117_g9097 [Phytophthora cactorum]